MARKPLAGVRRYPGFLAMTLGCLTILYAPLIVVMVYSFNDSSLDHAVGRVLTALVCGYLLRRAIGGVQTGGVEFR